MEADANDKILVIMGVSACGKSTIGRALAEILGWEFLDADDFHPQKNVEKMRAGIPLTDADRLPWLQTLIQQVLARRALVLACSSLKKGYRDFLRSSCSPVFVYLKADKALIQERMKQRPGHFMNSGLLESQFDALEEPEISEDAFVLDAGLEFKTILELICLRFGFTFPAPDREDL